MVADHDTTMTHVLNLQECILNMQKCVRIEDTFVKLAIDRMSL